MRGRSKNAISSACIYIACRQEGVPMFKEIVTISTVSRKEISRCYNLILAAHDIKVEIITAGDYMNQFCSTLGLVRDIQRAATIIAKRAEDLDLVLGRSPISVAAAAIYMASQVPYSCLY